MSALLEVRDLAVQYWTPRGRLQALRGISFALEPGAALGIAGESGSGKSTLARAVLGLAPIARGEVLWRGEPVATAAALARLRREVAVVFQDPVASLDPRFSLARSVEEPLGVHEAGLGPAERRRAAGEMLERVGLGPELHTRYPHELSGGQCQRAAIARAMITRPRLLICDEPWSALDVSLQAQLLALFAEFRRTEGTALLVISHHLAQLRRLCTRLLVLYLGRIAEAGGREALFGAPLHPYTRLLLDSVPVLGRPPRELGAGEPASPLAPPSGCAFRSRCRHTIALCAEAVPPLEAMAPGREVACVRAREGVAAAAD